MVGAKTLATRAFADEGVDGMIVIRDESGFTCARRRLSETRWQTITKQQIAQDGGSIEPARRAAIEVEVGAIRTFDLSRHSIRRLKFLCTKFGGITETEVIERLLADAAER